MLSLNCWYPKRENYEHLLRSFGNICSRKQIRNCVLRLRIVECFISVNFDPIRNNFLLKSSVYFKSICVVNSFKDTLSIIYSTKPTLVAEYCISFSFVLICNGSSLDKKLEQVDNRMLFS